MAYRSKTPDRAFDEIRELVTRYGVKRVECVDNILDNRYISTVFPRLAASGLGIDLFYEVKGQSAARSITGDARRRHDLHPAGY